jgi:hypothetical protein
MRKSLERTTIVAASVVLTLSFLVIVTLLVARMILVQHAPDVPPQPRLSRGEIERILAEAEALSGWRSPPQDYAKAAALYRTLAEQGEPRAQLRLGTLYAQGQGVPRDYAKAAALYRRAADQGNTDAMEALAAAIFQGDGVARDFDEMARLHQQAANKGVTVAKFHLAVCYHQGWGVKKDLVLAYGWFAAAAKDTVRDPIFADLARSNMRSLWKDMTEEERGQARQRLIEWHLD